MKLWWSEAWTVGACDRWRREVKMDTLSLRSNLVFLWGRGWKHRPTLCQVIFWGVRTKTSTFEPLKGMKNPITTNWSLQIHEGNLFHLYLKLYVIVQLEVENLSLVNPCLYLIHLDPFQNISKTFRAHFFVPQGPQEKITSKFQGISIQPCFWSGRWCGRVGRQWPGKLSQRF